MPITIPARLLEKLHSDSAYEGYIHTLLNNTASLITEKADFFPEYTIHGWTHIQAVLCHADRLIPDVTMEALTGRDAAILIAAVILHDLGMFLNKAGVRKLLTGSRRTTKTARLDKCDWTAEWDRYIHEIRRYPEEKLLYHFGMSHAIEEPDMEKGEFSDLELLIVGDFLRRQHHRIAHEIALDTMPGDIDVDVLQVGMDALGNKAFNSKDRRCIGILARSHGMPIRDTRDYIDREVGRQYKERLAYLMAVLRIADALDADEQRAPDTVRKLQGIRTPVSVQEWTWNQRITRTDLDWNNEADFKYVEAEPESTTEFVHLEKWLNWVQKELDTCWAVLSEICDTQKYRLSIHRIESNILEEGQRESYGEKFITKEARLNANPELLKLLVSPLYDDDPSCGVRELLQNAVDACNERAHLEGGGYRGQVEIRLDTATKTMTVTDNGIGMDENVLLNYYLSAGASYRTSDQWFEQFATGRDPDIVRTGRFGVGVLATFLLGCHIRVTTRHMDDDLGYTFEFGLEPKALDIKRTEEPPEIGTTITVTLKEDALEKLQDDYKDKKNWLNWYRFAEPSVRYWVDGEEYISGKPFIPQDDREMSGWFELPDTEYQMLLWSDTVDGVYCNGIQIPNAIEALTHSYNTTGNSRFRYPGVSVIDKHGKLPVGISRRTLQYFPERERLDNEANRYAMAQLLLADWSSEGAALSRFANGVWHYQGTGIIKYTPCICAADGFMLSDLAACYIPNSFSILELFGTPETDWAKFTSMLRKMKPSIPIMVSPHRITDDDIARNGSSLMRSDVYYISMGLFFPSIDHVWSNAQQFNYLSTASRSVFRGFEIRTTRKGCVEYVRPGNDNTNSLPFYIDYWDTTLCPSITKLTFSDQGFVQTESKKEDRPFFSNFIDTYMDGNPWIPYDMDERRKKFPRAFEELKYYIDRILADQEKEHETK